MKRPTIRKRGVSFDMVNALPQPQSVLLEKVKPFVPIENIDDYVWGLRREGFYSEEKIQEIETKHRDALARQPPRVTYVPDWTPRVSSTDQVYVKLVVGKTRVKVIAYHPYGPLFKWWKENPGCFHIPIEVIAEYHLLLGMPGDMVMRMVKRAEKKIVKELKPVVKKHAPIFE